MVPNKRSTLQCDLKDLSTKQSTAGEHHFVLASFTAIALFAIYISINTPSASTANITDIKERPNLSTTTIFPDFDLPVTSKLTTSINTQVDQPEVKSEQHQNLVNQKEVTDPDREATGRAVAKHINQPDVMALVSVNSPDETRQTAEHSLNSSLDSKIQPYTLQTQTVPDQPVIEQIEALGADVESASDLVDQSSSQKTRFSDLLKSQPWISTEVRKGDSLSRIFNRNDIGTRHAYEITQIEDAKSLLKIRPGQQIRIKKDKQGAFALLQYKLNTFNTLMVQAIENSYIVSVDAREPEIRLNNAKATIYQNLLGAAKNAEISSNTMYNFIAMFGWQVDFTMDLKVGDQFSIIYEELYLDSKKVGDGNIIAAELVISGKKLQAIRHEDDEGNISFYAPDGDGIKGTFLRTPLKFGHVTSNFSKNRLHPIKKVWTAHRGVDYGAPRGTPVMSTGDGTVRHIGKKGGYGKTIIIRHGGKYDTVYAHLNGYAKGVRSGTRVKQGTIIGYVGSTGLATGPHLHYEFRISGVHKNPMTVELPKSRPISEKYKSQFQQAAGIWVAELDYLNRIPLAQNIINQ